jgi:hypothetical protein
MRRATPWIARGFLAVSLAGLLWIAYDQSHSFGFGDDDGRLNALLDRYAELEKANIGLKSEVAVLDRQLQIERATYTDLVRQVKVLSQENARLREDVALLQTISTADSRTDGVKVSSVRVEPNPVPGEYSYRIVLLQTGSRAKPFLGRYQLVIDLMQNGKRQGMTLPAPGEGVDGTYRLDFRVHQRIDGTFRVDPGATVRSVELRVFEGRQSQPRVMQTIRVS